MVASNGATEASGSEVLSGSRQDICCSATCKELADALLPCRETEWQIKGAECTMFGARGLPDLQVVALRGVCPDHIHVPKQCGLHLAGVATLDKLGTEEWSSALANLQSLGIWKRTLCLQHSPDLFGDAQKWKNLSIVSIDVYHWGAGNAPVSLASLAHLQQIFVGAAEVMYVTVPAKVSWHKLGLRGGDRLEVNFENMDTFANTVRSGAFTSRNLAGPCLFHLCHTLAEHGIPWASRERGEYGETTLAFPSSDAGESLDCFCGACMECLRASGGAEACSKVLSVDDANGSDEESDDEIEDLDEEEEEVF